MQLWGKMKLGNSRDFWLATRFTSVGTYSGYTRLFADFGLTYVNGTTLGRIGVAGTLPTGMSRPSPTQRRSQTNN